MKLSIEETVSAPVERVFEVFSDVVSLEERISGIVKVEILSEVRSGNGVRWRETRVMFGKEATEEMDISDFDPPHSYQVNASSHGMSYVSVLNFESIDANSTRIVHEYIATPITFGARIMQPMMILFKGPLRKALHGDILELKAFVESDTATA